MRSLTIVSDGDALAAVRGFAAAIPRGSWFAACGEDLTPAEHADAAAYLARARHARYRRCRCRRLGRGGNGDTGPGVEPRVVGWRSARAGRAAAPGRRALRQRAPARRAHYRDRGRGRAQRRRFARHEPRRHCRSDADARRRRRRGAGLPSGGAGARRRRPAPIISSPSNIACSPAAAGRWALSATASSCSSSARSRAPATFGDDLMAFVIPAPPVAAIPVVGADSFPVHRIYCVGRNYADHAREMGHDPDREPPFFFMKPADAVVATGSDDPLPAETKDYQHEIELVVALGQGRRATCRSTKALDLRLWLCRRPRHDAARHPGRGQEARPAVGPRQGLRPVGAVRARCRRRPRSGTSARARSGSRSTARSARRATYRRLIWSVPETIAYLSRLRDAGAGRSDLFRHARRRRRRGQGRQARGPCRRPRPISWSPSAETPLAAMALTLATWNINSVRLRIDHRAPLHRRGAARRALPAGDQDRRTSISRARPSRRSATSTCSCTA